MERPCTPNEKVFEANKKWESFYGQVTIDGSTRIEFSTRKTTLLFWLSDRERKEKQGKWMDISRDQFRFDARIREAKKRLEPILKPKHREKIWRRNAF